MLHESKGPSGCVWKQSWEIFNFAYCCKGLLAVQQCRVSFAKRNLHRPVVPDGSRWPNSHSSQAVCTYSTHPREPLLCAFVRNAGED
eukprot:3667006-Pyramimonas_sp.AAC.1